MQIVQGCSERIWVVHAVLSLVLIKACIPYDVVDAVLVAAAAAAARLPQLFVAKSLSWHGVKNSNTVCIPASKQIDKERSTHRAPYENTGKV